MTLEATHFHSLQAELGEGPVWDGARGLLWCVDINAPALHAIDPATGVRNSWPAPAKIGWVLPASEDGLVAGLADGLYHFAPESGAFSLLAEVEPDLPSNRINDGTRGPDGAIWFGTMDDRETDAVGRFYRYDGEVRDCGLPPACITNGPAMSPGGTILYTVDTLAREIWANSIGADGSASDRRLFASIAPGDGWPDGVCCDAEGGVWLGLWDGWRARRYDASGEVTAEVRFPVANVTKIAIGGPDGRTAYATTARKGLGPADLAAQPLAGDLFSFAVDVGAAG
ncbi:SMP-30/gluconolactonase/LRE family protein [Sphingopyxis sp.]|jgi:sugar lactone lactonase YvrE|uniref:SMP-30/gluconolactonase/LRE family protein n=1 Tax=Sphingopyxis sp. TaxID=1908224 RepID=UPI002DEED683|nr:SMP-30/gluconolactonase/LRE family protein [Sphingopyxis sp.]